MSEHEEQITDEQARGWGIQAVQQQVVVAFSEGNSLQPGEHRVLYDGSMSDPAWRLLPHGQQVCEAAVEQEEIAQAYEAGIHEGCAPGNNLAPVPGVAPNPTDQHYQVEWTEGTLKLTRLA